MRYSSIADLPAAQAIRRRTGATTRNMYTMSVEEIVGRYTNDKFVLKLDLKASPPVLDTVINELGDIGVVSDLEASTLVAEYLAAVANKEFLQPKKPFAIENALPQFADRVEGKSIFTYKDQRGQIVMVETRDDNKDGGRFFLRYTYWEDERWRNQEPTYLPFYNMDECKKGATAFMHEGAKAAAYCQWLTDRRTPEAQAAYDAHPWALELSGAVHLGYTGGSNRADDADWRSVRGQIERLYIAPDNDAKGMSAIKVIAKHVYVRAFHINYPTSVFPSGFDLADPFPPKLFNDKGRYIGPSLRSVLQPCTWMTKNKTALREHAVGLWVYAREQDIYVHNDMIMTMLSRNQLNNLMKGLSDVPKTMPFTDVLHQDYRGVIDGTCYRPFDGQNQLAKFETINDPGKGNLLNVYTPSFIKPSTLPKAEIMKEIQIWRNFVDYLFVYEKERYGVEQWIATLIAKASVRIPWAPVIASEKEGTGKSTFAMSVAQCVGIQNTVAIDQTLFLNDNFNGHLENKTLGIFHEAESFHGRAMENKLRSLVVDDVIPIRRMRTDSYMADNHLHFMPLSNSLNVINIKSEEESGARRYAIPEVAETVLPPKRYIELHHWLKNGGYSIISGYYHKHWSGEYLTTASKPFMSARKAEAQDYWASPLLTMVTSKAEWMVAQSQPVFVDSQELAESWQKASGKMNGRSLMFESPRQIKKAMERVGVSFLPDRIKLKGTLRWVAMNAAAADKVREMGVAGAAAYARQNLTPINSLEDM